MKEFVRDSDIPLCPEAPGADQVYRLRVADLSPTQFATGKAEVQSKAVRMRRKFDRDPDKLHDYLRVRPVPVVGYKKRHYLVDHHHMVRALYEAMNDDVGDGLTVYVKVLTSVGEISKSYFWKQMFQSNWVYLFDHMGGGPQRPKDLPRHIKNIGFDPYRSLAWLVRDRHGYLKNDAPFSEFKWANFFRTRIFPDEALTSGEQNFEHILYDIDDQGRLILTDDGEEIVEEAMFLASTSEARGLPGYRGQP